MALVELVLYHAQTPTGTVEWSTTSDTGPWTAAQLSGPLPLREALAEWAATIGAAASRTVAWEWDGSALTLAVSGGSLWIKLSTTMRQILGSDIAAIEDGWESGGEVPVGIAVLPVGQPVPFEQEEAEVRRYRGARCAVQHFARTGYVALDLVIPSAQIAALEGAVLTTGTAAIKITWDNEDAFGEDGLDGSIILYPIGASIDPRQSDDEPIVTHLVGTTLDPGASIPPVRATAWTEFWSAVAYGYSPHFIARVEGRPTLFVEVVGDAVAPSGYDLDPSLVVDTSAMLGPVVRDSPIAAGYDLELRLLDTTAVRALMQRPTLVTQLRDECEVGDTALLVESIAGWSDVTVAYIGTSAEAVTGYLPRWMTVATRGVYGRERFYPKGTPVTDKPTEWQDCRVDLFAVLRDPIGNYVQGSDILDGAPAMWGGYVQERPIRNGSEWSMQCRDQVRRAVQPLGITAGGRAVWQVDDDGLIAVDANASFALEVRTNATDLESVVVRPFAGLSGQIRMSRARALVAEALQAAAVASGRVTTFEWRRRSDIETPGGSNPLWSIFGLYCTVTVTSSDHYVVAGADVSGSEVTTQTFRGQQAMTHAAASSTTLPSFCGLITVAPIANANLSVVLDEGDPAAIPEAGMVLIEGDGRRAIRRYSSAAADDADAGMVNLQLDATSALTQEEILALAANTSQTMSARFFWRDTGRIYDILRRALVSTGDGSGGTYDTLPKGQGLEVPSIDEDSFEDVFDGFFRDMSFDVGADAGTNLEELFGGIMRLSRRALVARRTSGATEIRLAAIRTGSVDGPPVLTITEDTLAFTGRKPVRVRELFSPPQAIEVRCKSLPVDDQAAAEGIIALRKAGRAASRRWTLDVYGVARPSLVTAAKAWARALFIAGENQQALELDVPIWIDAQPGQIVNINLTDPNVWDYAEAAPGLIGAVRVLGSQVGPTTGVQVLTVDADGIFLPGPMAPSIAIVAVNGTASSPTSIDVDDDDELLAVLTAAKDGQSSWKVLAYLPGQDAGRAEYTISTITQPGGGVTRLTVTAYPSAPAVTLTTSYRLTWPVEDNGTDDQARYLHNTDRVQWS